MKLYIYVCLSLSTNRTNGFLESAQCLKKSNLDAKIRRCFDPSGVPAAPPEVFGFPWLTRRCASRDAPRTGRARPPWPVGFVAIDGPPRCSWCVSASSLGPWRWRESFRGGDAFDGWHRHRSCSFVDLLVVVLDAGTELMDVGSYKMCFDICVKDRVVDLQMGWLVIRGVSVKGYKPKLFRPF